MQSGPALGIGNQGHGQGPKFFCSFLGPADQIAARHRTFDAASHPECRPAGTPQPTLRPPDRGQQPSLITDSLIERGALDKFFSVSSNVNVNEDQGQESGHEQEHDHNLAAEVEVNEDATENSENVKSLDDNDLWKCCTTFAEAFSHDNSSHVDLNDFISELQVLQVILPDDLMSAPEIFQFITVEDCYPNVSITYRILLTIHVTVASAERSFSKLKLLKNYLRSTMSQDRLNGIATCSIEKGILENVDLNIVLADFASRNARRSFLL
ncbi:hypothetical protein SASPL_146900 [Salvia splendens]|uniref:HAT C-terminal dimerisation domain-containing protein n=1 Tax=Salvia splendens TaxID=180675 RepID=A0A8X8WDI4_SALSN|nr:hypothetical protein SASPL_146900 [Salvia splendens]